MKEERDLGCLQWGMLLLGLEAGVNPPLLPTGHDPACKKSLRDFAR